MSKCDLCNKESEELRECRECGRFFCESCGNKDEKLCKECEEFSPSEVVEKQQEKEILDDLQEMEFEEE